MTNLYYNYEKIRKTDYQDWLLFLSTFDRMRKIFKYKTGKDFYRDALEYFEYDPLNYEKEEEDYGMMEHEEVAYYVAQKMRKMRKMQKMQKA